MLSVVVPAKDEAGNIEPLLRRLAPVLDRIGGPAEILLVDDGSTDGTLAAMKRARAADPRIRILSFSRNFGKDIALAAGLRYARGKAVVLMDADLQHPPELIVTFVARWREGWQVVYAQRRDRLYQSWAKRWAARWFYRLFARIGEIGLLEGGGDFCLLDARVVRALDAMPERARFAKAFYAWVGFRQLAVPFEVGERYSGRSQWSFWRLWLFALDGLISFSSAPLRMWSYLGVAISLLAIAFGLYILIEALVLGVSVPGYPSLMAAMSLFAGVQLITLGVIGEYLGRIFTEVKRRPLFLIAEAVGFEPGVADDPLPAPPPAPERPPMGAGT